MLQTGNSVLMQTFGIESLGIIALVVTAIILYAKYSKGYEAIKKKFVGREKLNTIAMAIAMTVITGVGMVTGYPGQIVAIVTGVATIVYTSFFMAFMIDDAVEIVGGLLSK